MHCSRMLDGYIHSFVISPKEPHEIILTANALIGKLPQYK